MCIGLGAWARVSGAPSPAGVKTITILHTTDLHGHILPTVDYQGVEDVGGLARCASRLQGWREECPHHLLVDLGDVIQGTPVSLASRGKLMMDLFRHLKYDAWVIGNHDLDWGRPVIEGVLRDSPCPVLTANLTVDGQPTASAKGPWPIVKPWVIKEFNGLRIALIGLTTPGMPMWLPPETLDGIAATDPLDSLRAHLAEVKASKPNAIVLLGHMGWKFKDDSDNPVRALLEVDKDIDVYLGGHSHQDQAMWKWDGVTCSQAGYHGIWCGRLDLHFNATTGKLIDARAHTQLMDSTIAADPAVLQIAGPALDVAAKEQTRVLRVFVKPIKGKGRDSELVRWISGAFSAALAKAGRPVDGVFHGTFATGDVPAGPFTVADAWKILPYENLLCTARLTSGDLLAIVAEDETHSRSDRTLVGFEIERNADGKPVGLRREGKPIADATQRFSIGINSYDAQSGGGRLPVLKERVFHPEANRQLTDVETRDALILHAEA